MRILVYCIKMEAALQSKINWDKRPPLTQFQKGCGSFFYACVLAWFIVGTMSIASENISMKDNLGVSE